MVQVTVTPEAEKAIKEYCRQKRDLEGGEEMIEVPELESLRKVATGAPIDHHDLLKISDYLVQRTKSQNDGGYAETAKAWRLDTLLKGANIYQAPPSPKKEPVRVLSREGRFITNSSS